MRISPLPLLALVGLLAPCACGPAGSPIHSSNAGEAHELLSVRIVKPERKMVRRTTTQPATVHAYFKAEVHAKVAGYLRELKVDIGAEVEEGSVLGILDIPEMGKRRERQEAVVRRLEAAEKRAAAGIAAAGANVESHEAMLEEAGAVIRKNEALRKRYEIEYQRLQNMVKDEAATQQELEEAEARYASSQATKLAAEAAAVSAKANVALAKARLNAAQADLKSARAETDVARMGLEELDALMSYAILRAPFGGVVVERNVDPGDLVRDSSSSRDDLALFVIAQLERVRVRVPVPERDAPWASVGDMATLTVLAIPGTQFRGQIDRLAGSLHEGTRTMLIEIDLPNPDRRLLPGMFGEATIVLEEHEALVLPASAVRHDEVGNSYVYVVDEKNMVQVVDVVTGLDTGQEIEITGGLEGDERIVPSTLGRIRPGTTVRIRD